VGGWIVFEKNLEGGLTVDPPKRKYEQPARGPG
jgi:hypothetical protein